MGQPAIIFRTLTTTKGTIQIAQRPFDGYINVTPMCYAVQKYPANWKENQSAKDYLEELSLDVGIPIANLIQTIQGRGDRMEQGTWVHPLIASRIAQWCHPSFAVQVDRWVLEILSGRSVQPQRPPMTQALVDALDAHDAHFFQVDARLDDHDKKINRLDSNIIRIEQVYHVGQKKRQTAGQRHNRLHRDDVMREKAYRFASGRCMNPHCLRALWLHPDESPGPDAVANVDHVHPVNTGGTLVWNNLQVLCLPCHQRKTLAERQAGRHVVSMDFRHHHPGFVGKCAEQQSKDELQRLAHEERRVLPLFDGSCLPLPPPGQR